MRYGRFVKDELISPPHQLPGIDHELKDAARFIEHHHVHSNAGPVPGVNLDGIRRVISDIAASRAEIGFSTSGHTGIDINVYAYGSGMHRLVGNQDNTNVGKVIQDVLELDLDAVTRDLNKK